MKNTQKLYGGLLGTIGFLLSPLSWWNDIFINFPIAYLCASLVSFIYRPAFLGVFIISYWLTNIAGFILMQKGIARIINSEAPKKGYSFGDFMRDILFSLGYTILIIILVKRGIVKPL